MKNKKSNKVRISAKLKGYLILLALVVASYAIFKLITPNNFGAPEQLLDYFQASLLAAVGASGFYFVMVMGMFDFSIGANIILSSITGCVLATTCGLGYFGVVFTYLMYKYLEPRREKILKVFCKPFVKISNLFKKK